MTSIEIPDQLITTDWRFGPTGTPEDRSVYAYVAVGGHEVYGREVRDSETDYYDHATDIVVQEFAERLARLIGGYEPEPVTPPAPFRLNVGQSVGE